MFNNNGFYSNNNAISVKIIGFLVEKYLHLIVVHIY